jgi:hypothetical protein
MTTMTTMTTDDDDGDGDGDGGAIDVYYDAGVFFTSARASVDSATAPPVEATTTPTAMDAKAACRTPPVERRRVLELELGRRRRGRGRGQTRTTDDEFHDGDVLGREVGRRWEGGRVSDVSDDNAGGGDAAMTEDETPRFSNVRHRSQGNDDRAPDSTTILPPPPSPPSYCDRRSHGCIPPPNDYEDEYRDEQQIQTPHTWKGGLGIESNNQHLWSRSAAYAAEGSTDANPSTARRSCS